MQLTEAQKKIAESKARFRVVCAGRRLGKTTLAVLELIGASVYKDNANCVYIAPTYQQARDICWQELLRQGKSAIKVKNEARLEVTMKTVNGGESKIALRGWESVETLRGQAFDFMVIDEIAMMKKFWVNWREVLRPALTDKRGTVLFISTPKGFNHFYDLYNTKDDDYESFHFTSYDNPHLPKDEIDKAQLELTADSFAQEYMADFRKAEGLVYTEFSRTRHLFKDHNIKTAEYLAGVDFGYTNPACVLSIRKDTDGCYYVLDEWYKSGKTHEEIGEYVASRGYNKVYADPASPEAIEVMRQKGVNIQDVSKAKDSITTGVQKVRDLFKQGRIKIHESCDNLISELETYHYPEEKVDSNESEIPVKDKDHALDALRYVIMTNVPLKRDNSERMRQIHLRRRRGDNQMV